MIKEECGIAGIFKNENAAEILYTCLFSLQHRGQESSGIIVSDGSSVNAHRAVGLVSDVFTQDVIKSNPYWWNKEGKYTVVVIDCGTKYNILRLLAERNLRVWVVPANFPSEEIIKENPDGILLSNGQGDLEPLDCLVRTVQNLVERYPMFGICLGQQILGQAFGGKTFKLKFGHHGANHSVKDSTTGKIYITVQNHGFCVDIESLRDPHLEITHINLNDQTLYIELLVSEVLEKIIEIERTDALLPTIGGQTGLNLAVELWEKGILEKYEVRLIGANYDAIRKAEDSQLFKQAIINIGLSIPRSGIAYCFEEGMKIGKGLGFPIILRPSFTLGGTGGAIVYNMEELTDSLVKVLELSLNREVLLEESVLGWKEFELDVMRDIKDNVVIICSVENFDPMGIHTGDSITVAPAQTLTDKEYQKMRDAAIGFIREIKVETGGSNIQFAINLEDGRMVVIEMNPRVSRSFAFASKATGFPIAKIATKLAIGYTLDEVTNDITRKTPVCFESTIDYCVVKIPKFNFEKFPNCDTFLNASMKSVGEVMSIGRTFKEALSKGLRSLETNLFGFESKRLDMELDDGLRYPNADRLFYIKKAFDEHYSIDRIYQLTKIDRWFLANLQEIWFFEKELYMTSDLSLNVELVKKAKELGFSDVHIARILGRKEEEIRHLRKKFGIMLAYKMVDTCAGEFEASTPYYYSTYEQSNLITTGE